MSYGDVSYSLGWDTFGWDTMPWGGFQYTDNDINAGSTIYTDSDPQGNVTWTENDLTTKTPWS